MDIIKVSARQKEISLEVAFNRLLIIASDVGNRNLIDWATNELNGYPSQAQIPSYRKSGLGQILSRKFEKEQRRIYELCHN